jgi:predicted  nucleic acid-binding Zn-ribbon protein
VNADPAAQLALLDLQALDTELAQLAHRRRTLPALAVIVDRRKQGAELNLRTVELETAVGDIAKEQSRLEADIDVVRQREARNQQRLDAGGIPAKELSGLEHELETLKRRQDTLEDEVLEVMERRERTEAELAEARSQEGEVAEQQAAAEQDRDSAFAEIDAAVLAKREARAPLAASIPDDLRDLYDKIRVGHDGVGAAALKQRRCQGCHIELAGSELNDVRNAAADEIVRCDNCRRILVRTAKSGL